MPSQLPPCRATVLFIALTPQKRQKIFLSLPLRLSLRSHCILWSVLLFKCSYSPFRRRATFKPTVTMATPICIWKSAFEGANEMRNNMPRHCASLSKYSKYGHMRNVRWVVLGGGGGGGVEWKYFLLFYLFHLYDEHIHKRKMKKKQQHYFRSSIFYKSTVHECINMLVTLCIWMACIGWIYISMHQQWSFICLAHLEYQYNKYISILKCVECVLIHFSFFNEFCLS